MKIGLFESTSCNELNDIVASLLGQYFVRKIFFFFFFTQHTVLTEGGVGSLCVEFVFIRSLQGNTQMHWKFAYSKALSGMHASHTVTCSLGKSLVKKYKIIFFGVHAFH